MSNLLKRALVTFTLGPLALFLIYLGGWYYFVSFGILLTLASIEYAHLVKKLGWRVPSALLLPVLFALWFLPPPVQEQLFKSGGLQQDLIGVALLIGLLLALSYVLWLYERRVSEDAPGSWMALFGGIVLMGWLGSFFFRLRGVNELAAQWTSLAMLATWVADSGAYVFGKSLGRHKLSPRLSPNKTVEGYLGGVVVGTAATVPIALILDLPLDLSLLIGFLVSSVSPAGDLGVSLLKRTVGVKDSGHLLPGHGGALDRIDSLIWSVAIAYYLVFFLG